MEMGRLCVGAVAPRLGVALAVAAVFLISAPVADAQDSADVRVRLGVGSSLTFVGGTGIPVSLVLGYKSGPSGSTTCTAIQPSDDFSITLRLFQDQRSGDAAPFRVCNAVTDPNDDSAIECANANTPISSADLSQEDGVARVEVVAADLPAGACAVGGSTESFFLGFKAVCGTPLQPEISGHKKAFPSETNSCVGSFEDQGFGRFGEAVFSDPPLGSLDETGFQNIATLRDDTTLPTWEARRNGLRLNLPLVAVQEKFGGLDVWTADIELAFEITSGAVGGHAVGTTLNAPREVPLGSGGSTLSGNVCGNPGATVPCIPPPPERGAVLTWSDPNAPSGAISLAGAVATSLNDPNTDIAHFNVWTNSIAFLTLPGAVTPCAGSVTETSPCGVSPDSLATKVRSVFPDFDGDSIANAIDPDDDNDNLLDDGLQSGAMSAQVPLPISLCESEDDLSSDPGECLLGNFERSFQLQAPLCTAKASPTDPLDPDSDADGLADGRAASWAAPADPQRFGEDVDFDGCLDGSETNPIAADTDGDALNDGFERNTPYPEFESLTEFTDPLDTDSDGDLLSDGFEVNTTYPAFDVSLTAHSNPLVQDTDHDGLNDKTEVDAIYDPFDPGLTEHTFPVVVDTDSDGLGDGQEVTVYLTNPLVADTDVDGYCDGSVTFDPRCVANDNCRIDFNPGQEDNDLDGLGDVCDPDDDNDAVLDGVDNCQFLVNADQKNTDGDAFGDVCDPDDDNDTVLDGLDNCPLDVNTDQKNTDGDAFGDVCDPDDDNDTVLDGLDNCPLDVNAEQKNTDGDADGDVCDTDDDNDLVLDGGDNCPLIANADQKNTDGDADGDACDTDDDNDEYLDGADNCPLVANFNQSDSDIDGYGDVCDNCAADANPGQEDGDIDGYGNICDNCEAVANPGQEDVDVDGYGNVCDNCPYTANPAQEDSGSALTDPPDAIGDACQCGDVNDDGIVDDADVSAYRDSLADPSGLGLTPAGVAKCSVIDSAGPCEILDVTVIERALEEPEPYLPGIDQVCTAATPAP